MEDENNLIPPLKIDFDKIFSEPSTLVFGKLRKDLQDKIFDPTINKPGFIYCLYDDKIESYKIGRSGNLPQRIKAHKLKHGNHLEYVFSYFTNDDYVELENDYHSTLKIYRSREHEWYFCNMNIIKKILDKHIQLDCVSLGQVSSRFFRKLTPRELRARELKALNNN